MNKQAYEIGMTQTVLIARSLLNLPLHELLLEAKAKDDEVMVTILQILEESLDKFDAYAELIHGKVTKQ